MPSVSKKQERFMQAVANNPKFAKKAGVPQSVGKEFTKSGGGMATKMNPGMMAMMKKKSTDKPAKKMAMGGYADGGMPMVMKDGKKVPSFAADGQGKMKKGGMACAPKKMASGGLAAGHKSADGIVSKGKTKAKQVTMKNGGKC